MRPERLERPAGQRRLEPRRVGAARPLPVVAEVAPGERLIEEGVDVGIVAEEALALAAPVDAQRVGIPGTGRSQHGFRHLLHRELAEVHVGREPARVAFLERARLGALFRIAAQPPLHERAQARASGRATHPACPRPAAPSRRSAARRRRPRGPERSRSRTARPGARLARRLDAALRTHGSPRPGRTPCGCAAAGARRPRPPPRGAPAERSCSSRRRAPAPGRGAPGPRTAPARRSTGSRR